MHGRCNICLYAIWYSHFHFQSEHGKNHVNLHKNMVPRHSFFPEAVSEEMRGGDIIWAAKIGCQGGNYLGGKCYLREGLIWSQKWPTGCVWVFTSSFCPKNSISVGFGLLGRHFGSLPCWPDLPTPWGGVQPAPCYQPIPFSSRPTGLPGNDVFRLFFFVTKSPHASLFA